MQDIIQQNVIEQSFITDEGVTVREIGKPNIEILANKLIELHGVLNKKDIKIKEVKIF